MVVYQDESWFSGNPKPVGQYGRPNHPQAAAVEKPPHQCKGAWVLYAAYEALTGQVQRYYAPRCNQTQVRQQLEALLGHSIRQRANGCWWSSGITPRGIRRRPCAAGITATTSRRSARATSACCWCLCPVAVPGSTRWSRSLAKPSGMWSAGGLSRNRAA